MAALTFPREMPLVGVGRQVFTPFQVGFTSATTGGSLFAVTAGVKRWRAEWTLANALTGDQADEWMAFIDSLDGANRTFFGRDFSRLFPRLYPLGFAGLNRAGGGAFDGSFTSWSQTITADGQALATFHGAPAGLALSRGDYVDFRWTTSGIERRHLIRLLAPATADGTGDIVDAPVSPAVHVTVVPGSAVAHLDNPTCVMRIAPDQTQVTEMDRRRIPGARIVALQDLRS